MTFSKALLAWYDANARDLPWRVKSGVPDPYHVWLSEIMLQQTTVATVRDYFYKFITRWPGVEDLAAASEDDVLHAWQGLGYYARARNLLKCARAVVHAHNGRFPSQYEDLLNLPGIGPYTAGAIAMIAFNRPAVAVDGNVERVLARYGALDASGPALKKEAGGIFAAALPADRPGDFLQALMDLGATVCRPKNPLCTACPLFSGCRAYAVGEMESYPVKAPKKARPVKSAAVFWLENKKGEVLIRQRPRQGLLGGLMEFPTSDWAQNFNKEEALGQAPAQLDWQVAGNPIRHVFTHFELRLYPYRAQTLAALSLPGTWVRPENLNQHALPTLMRKVEYIFTAGST